VGNVSTSAPAARLAVSGFAALLKDGAAAPRPSEVRHPRTALGVDRGRRYLVLAVVDGRQPGYSEGMSEREMADLMLELGCADALNLDGGGSTAMVLRDATGTLRIVNRPSDPAGARPVPVFLGVRQRRP
jgi:exopolysaccharide biosynthesis protein